MSEQLEFWPEYEVRFSDFADDENPGLWEDVWPPLGESVQDLRLTVNEISGS